MAKRAAKRAAQKPSRKAARAAKRADDLHRKADALHKQSEKLHVASDATHKKAHEVAVIARQRPSGGSTPKNLSRRERVEPTTEAGAPTPEALSIVETRPSALPFSVVGVGASAGGFEAAVGMVSYLPKT